MDNKIREIPYNYTSFSDREIVIRFLGEPLWETLNQLRAERRTGRSARMLFEVLGDMWIVQRNPFIQDDLLDNSTRRASLIHALRHRLEQIVLRASQPQNTSDADNKTAIMSVQQRTQLVLQLVNETKLAVSKFETWLNGLQHRRQQIFARLAKITMHDNIQFDGISRVAHVTDATDWRVEYPEVVITPDTETETLEIVKACIELGLTIIPRGGGTGYTGGAIPLHSATAIINTEKLNAIGKLEQYHLLGTEQTVSTVEVGAGVVTRRVTEFATDHNLIFAIDPTSQDASTIGGNISVNAGGKKAVRYGVTLDNLVSWRMVTPNAEWIVVERLQHNLGKIHDAKEALFQVTQLATDGKTAIRKPQLINIPTYKIRKPGLGKDVTNKFLGGLPGVQKEGCDGLITSARFVLHSPPAFMRTVCLEFFGLVKNAVPAILETKQFLDAELGVELMGSEHIDERYVRAINYNTKSSRAERPKMVLLLDVGGNDETKLDQAVEKVVQIAIARGAEGFIAVSAEARAKFWHERSRTAAIAAHTNAFKLNEDVVIPLERLAEYNDGIERINIIQSTRNKLTIIETIIEFIHSLSPANAISNSTLCTQSTEDTKIFAAKLNAATALLSQVYSRWSDWILNLDVPVVAWDEPLPLASNVAVQPNDTLFDLLQQRLLKISYRTEIAAPLQDIFAGEEFQAIRQQFEQIHASLRNSRLFVATHAHAGDGNVHTNIPVFSNDYQMLQEAELVVQQIMALAKKLDGVISGEHGIGVTKFKFLDQQNITDFAAYKQRIDPHGHFNKGKLLPGFSIEHAYTPSLRLVEQEALILKDSALGELNDLIRHCLRCGKCKPVCTTHVPGANLLYSPRNKILAASLIIEAVLYEEQTRRGISVQHFAELNDIAEHCTVCRRCAKPCPVHIDFAHVTAKMRNILRNVGKKPQSLMNWASMQFLNTTDSTTIGWLRFGLIRGGYTAQRFAHATAKQLGWLETGRPLATPGTAHLKEQIIHLVKRPMPGHLHALPMRKVLGIDDPTHVTIIRDPKRTHEGKRAVFYFPGCGSERLFTQIGLATLAMLYHTGAEIVLAPGYLCCGYPQIASGDTTTGQRIVTANRILFHRVANTLNYLDIKTVLVSCGTCLEQLTEYHFDKIFPDSRLLDIHEYLIEQNVTVEGLPPQRLLYHDPCHSPIKTHNAVKLASSLMGQTVFLSDRCCGEAGTFAISRPDIATQVRFRKQQELGTNIASLPGQGSVKILTTCPACFQGLSRYRDQLDIEVSYPVIELAKHKIGANWEQQFLHQIRHDSVERVLL